MNSALSASAGSGPVVVVAEAGVNHNGSLETACRLIDAAKEAGADVVKFQTFRADRLAAKTARRAAYQIRNDAVSVSETQHAMLSRLELSESDHHVLLRHCQARGIGFLSTPFDLKSLAFLLDSLDLARIKIGSGDLTNAPLIWHAARSGRPLLLSTGMASLGEIEEALAAAALGFQGIVPEDPRRICDCLASAEAVRFLQRRVVLMHCTTDYPTAPEDVNLKTITTLQAAFGIPVGYSDHSEGWEAAVAAVALGAVVIEKHLTLDRGLPGPDHAASLDPEAFSVLVKAVRVVERSLGSSVKATSPQERENRAVARKGLVAAVPIAAGEVFTEDALAVLRPEQGLPPLYYWSLLGRVSPCSFQAGEPIRLFPSTDREETS